jgi:sporulation protein YlmC with PRC-barrel domain
MHKCLFALAAPALCLFVTATAFGQEQRNDAKRTIHPAGQILGMEIRNPKGDSLGYVEDIVVNLKDGKTVYVAMSRNKVLGFGGSFYAIAPDALRPGTNNEFLVLDATNQEFENAKGFDQNNWPRTPERRWGKSTATRNDETPRAENVENGKGYENMARVTAITGLPVYGRGEGDKEAMVGRIYDFAMNCNEHQIAYAAVHHGGTLGVGGKLIAVPWQALTLRAPALDPQRRAFFINATAQQFEAAEGFTSDNWPTEPNARFRDLKREGAPQR